MADSTRIGPSSSRAGEFAAVDSELSAANSGNDLPPSPAPRGGQTQGRDHEPATEDRAPLETLLVRQRQKRCC